MRRRQTGQLTAHMILIDDNYYDDNNVIDDSDKCDWQITRRRFITEEKRMKISIDFSGNNNNN